MMLASWLDLGFKPESRPEMEPDFSDMGHHLLHDVYINWGSGAGDDSQLENLLDEGLPLYIEDQDDKEDLFGPRKFKCGSSNAHSDPSCFNPGGIFGRIVLPRSFTDFSISDTGLISGTNESGEVVQVANLILTSFMNPGGLNRVGGNLYKESLNSGVPTVSIPGQATAGSLLVGALEMSTVDLSKEFTDMISTQRGYQACSRMITVSDTMLEEYIGLKR